jgi:DNA-binding Lrp family transcriptional regulator
MDHLDKQILEALQEKDSLTPRVTELSKRLGKSPTTLYGRIKKLEDSGVIRGYSVQIDAKKAGKDLVAFYFVKTSRGTGNYTADSVIKELIKLPEVRNIYNTMGEWDVMVEISVKDSEAYLQFIRKMEPIRGIIATKGKTVLEVHHSKFNLTD